MALLTYVVVAAMLFGTVVSEKTFSERYIEQMEREGFKDVGRSAGYDIMTEKLENYNSYEFPNTDRPTEVRLGIYINSFYSVSDVNMDFSISFYLRQAWQDPRLAFDSVDGIDSIVLEDLADKIWIPDTFFRNEKDASFHTVTTKNRLTKVNSTGHVWHVTKITATLSSPMQLQRYPMDQQQLPVMFESFSNLMDAMYFAWLETPVEIDASVQLPQFTLTDVVTHDCSQNYTMGAFPCLELEFLLTRDSGYYVMQVFIPSILLVILSWGGFWAGVSAMTARATLGLLTVLVMTTLSSGAQASLPKVSYMKAIDIWIGVCMIFIMATLLEAAIVNNLCEKEGGNEKMASEGKHPKAERVNTICKIVFPVAFLAFNIIFWSIYAA